MRVPVPVNFNSVGMLGRGAQGIVLKLQHKVQKNYCCLKCIRLKDSATSSRAIEEMRVFSRLAHPNIVKCVSAKQHMNFALIQMEYACGGDLGKLVEQR